MGTRGVETVNVDRLNVDDAGIEVHGASVASTSHGGQRAVELALTTLAAATGVANDGVEIAGDVDGDPIWRGPFAVDAVAVACVATATAAIADLAAVRNGTGPAPVSVDARQASACFASEGLVEPTGWTIPPVWDPVAGDYRTADGWIRLHTNYGHHRRAALRAMGVDDGPGLSRADLAPTVASWAGEDLEAAVVAAGGVAARQRSIDEWRRHPAGRAVGAEPLLDRVPVDAAADPLPPAARPLDGVRVLDLTRVLAGPTATGVLAAWGADVLRIDPPGFTEVPAIVPITTAGKRTASLDLRTAADRRRLLGLIAEADVVVHGYRSDALGSIGLDPASWRSVRPGLVEVTLDAYGWTGPWADRRGFDSIVQHSVGITSVGRDAVGADQPVPLPCQALDHGCGWLLAAAAAAGLAQRCRARPRRASTHVARPLQRPGRRPPALGAAWTCHRRSSPTSRRPP